MKYRYFSNGTEVKTLYKWPLDITGSQSKYHSYLNCHRANYCIFLKHGRLYTCSAAPNAHIINEYFDLGMAIDERENGIDIYSAGKKEILCFLARPIPFCKYCNIDAKESGFEWSQSKKEKSEWL